MAPTLSDGDYLITIKPRSFQPGLIYVIDHTDLGRIVKRLKRLDDGRLIVTGDNPNSTPPSIIAPIVPERVVGRATLAITQSGLKRL